MSHPPIRDGAVLIGADGRIAAVGPDEQVPSPDDVRSERFPDAAILPGLINTHTHVELTGFDGPANDPDFADWIRRLRERKAERSFEAFLDAARSGVAQCHAAGVTTIADTGDSGSVSRALTEAGGSGVVYQEVFGPDPGQRDASLATVQAQWRALAAGAGARVTIGVSPHAPYSVSGPLYAAVAAWAAALELPLAVHVAESESESELLEGRGPFAEAWKRRGIEPPAGAGCSPVAWLARHGVLGPRTLCIHAVRLNERDVDLLASSGSTVAHCPLSNRAHRHGDAPLRAMLDAGIVVGVGTDSVASVGRLDLMAEVRAARDLAGLDAGEALALCTTSAARALHLEREIGALESGLWGDCAVVGLDSDPMVDPVGAVVASGPDDVLATCIGGNEVYRASRVAARGSY